jgi:hypothetical protein
MFIATSSNYVGIVSTHGESDEVVEGELFILFCTLRGALGVLAIVQGVRAIRRT